MTLNLICFVINHWLIQFIIIITSNVYLKIVYVNTSLMLINKMWTQMSRQWMYMTERRSMEFIDGVHEFIKVAENHKYGGFVRCPCKNYKNEKDYSSSRTIHSHLWIITFFIHLNDLSELLWITYWYMLIFSTGTNVFAKKKGELESNPGRGAQIFLSFHWAMLWFQLYMQ